PPRLSADKMVDRESPCRPNQQRALADLLAQGAGPAVGPSDFGGGEAPRAHQQRTERDQEGKLVTVALRCAGKLLQDCGPLQQVSRRLVVRRSLLGIVGCLPKVF